MPEIRLLPEISELDLIAELLRIICDEHVIDGDAIFDFAVARGLAEHLRANYRVVPREPDQGGCSETNDHAVIMSCDRYLRRVGHKPHDDCPGHPGRHVPAEDLANLPASASTGARQ